jgi:regulator of sigma E protease
MSVFLLVVGIILFIGLVVVHEWGHFIMARRNGVEVEEFGIFFPPRLYKHRTKGGWLFTINLLPLGGFVKLKGEHDSDTAKGSYGAATVWAKTKIMAAGVFMNAVVGVVLLTIVALVGMPQLVPNQFTVKSDTKVTRSEVIVSYVEPGSPAAKAGLTSTDHIESIQGPHAQLLSVTNPDQLKAATKRFAGEQVTIRYARAGVEHIATTTLRTNQVVVASQNTDSPKGQLGIAPASYSLQRSTWSAPVVAVGLTGQFTALTVQGLGKAVAGLGSIIAGSVTGNTSARQNGQTNASQQVSGPVGIFVILQDGSLLGYQFILMIIAIISLTLAIMNILPIPALDGGRLWLTLITRGIKKPLTPKLEERINASGFALLLALVIVITIVDIRRFF